MSSQILTSMFLPYIRDIVTRNPKDFAKLDLMCNICLRYIPKGVQKVPVGDAESECSQLVALSCGHMFGACVLDWFGKDYFAPSTCPLCRQGSSDPSKCITLSLETAQDVIQASKCLPEGGEFPESTFQDSCVFIGSIVSDVISTPEEELEPEVLTAFPDLKQWGFSGLDLADLSSVAVVFQSSWNSTFVLALDHSALLFESPKHAERLCCDSRHCKFEDDRFTHIAEHNPLGLSISPPFKFPFLATADGDGPISKALKDGLDLAKDRIWGPAIVHLGIGFSDQIEESDYQHNAAIMQTPRFQKALAASLARYLKDGFVPETKSTRLV